MTTLSLVLIALIVVVALKHLVHLFRYKTDPFYRLQAEQAGKAKEFEVETAKFRRLFPR